MQAQGGVVMILGNRDHDHVTLGPLQCVLVTSEPCRGGPKRWTLVNEELCAERLLIVSVLPILCDGQSIRAALGC